MLAQARAVGVDGCITISTTTHDCLEALAIARAHERVWCTAGVHPLYSDTTDARAALRAGEAHVWENLRTVARDAKCVAWGELGLDNHYPTPAPSVQRRVLDEQLGFIRSVNHGGPGGIGKARGLPIVVHCREAFAELLPVFRDHGVDTSRCVFHCFTGSAGDARAVLDAGAWISFTGVLTYPNAPELRAIARALPLDRFMVETDAPFLPPVPHRGKRPCVPAWVVHTAEALAQARGVSPEAMHEQLNRNTLGFFGIG